MQQETGPRTIAAVQERIAGERAQLEALVGRLTEAQLTQPAPDGGWSVKDHLAHLGAWQRYLLAVLEHQPTSVAFGLDQARLQALDTDGINAHLYQRDKDRPLREVLADFRDVYERVVAALARLDDADVGPLLGKIAANSYEHDAEHRAWIQAAISRSTGSSAPDAGPES